MAQSPGLALSGQPLASLGCLPRRRWLFAVWLGCFIFWARDVWKAGCGQRLLIGLAGWLLLGLARPPLEMSLLARRGDALSLSLSLSISLSVSLSRSLSLSMYNLPITVIKISSDSGRSSQGALFQIKSGGFHFVTCSALEQITYPGLILYHYYYVKNRYSPIPIHAH